MKETALLFNPPAPPGSQCVIRDFYCSFSSKADYYWPPQDLLALSGVLREDYDVQVIDAVASGLGPAACREMIQASRASVMIFATGSVSLTADMAFMGSIPKREGSRWLASASLFHSAREATLRRYPFLDDVISDFTDPSILDRLRGKEARKVVAAEFSLGRPLYEHFIGRGKSLPFFGGAFFSIMTSSFGCEFSCGFCTAGTYRIKFRDMKEVLEDIGYLKSRGVGKIFFVDPLFTADPQRVLRFCDAVRDLKMEWICNAHVDTIQDEALLCAMEAAGCRVLLIGVESGDEDLLKRWGKRTDVGRIKKAFALCRKHRIATLGYFIIGLPGEDRESSRKTVRFAKELRCDYASFGYATPDEGTRLRKEALEKGWCSPSEISRDFDSSQAPVLGTETLPREEAVQLFQEAYRSFYFRPGYILSALLKVRSLTGLGALFRTGRAILKKNI